MLLFLHFLLACCTTAMVLHAQPGYRIPDDCNPCKRATRAWDVIPMQTRFVMAGDCLFKVYFKKRVCSHDGCQEMKVFKASPIDPVPCLGENPDEIATMLIGEMITNNLMDFLPDSIRPGRNGCWRVTRPSCWRLGPAPPPCNVLPPPEPTDSFHVHQEVNDLFPCDTTRCCTNVIYPTVDGCGDVVYNIPHARDYITLGSSGNPYIDSIQHAEWELAKSKVLNMFTDTTCKGCTLIGGPHHPVPDPTCHFDCPEDVVAAYWRILNNRVRRQSGE